MAHKVRYEAKLRDRKTQMAITIKKGKIRIRENDNYKTVADKVAEKHKLDLNQVDMDLRLFNFSFKPKSK